MNELCELKGHMLYVSKRKDVEKEDGLHSIAIEKKCVRCGLIKELEVDKE